MNRMKRKEIRKRDSSLFIVFSKENFYTKQNKTEPELDPNYNFTKFSKKKVIRKIPQTRERISVI